MSRIRLPEGSDPNHDAAWRRTGEDVDARHKAGHDELHGKSRFCCVVFRSDSQDETRGCRARKPAMPRPRRKSPALRWIAKTSAPRCMRVARDIWFRTATAARSTDPGGLAHASRSRVKRDDLTPLIPAKAKNPEMKDCCLLGKDWVAASAGTNGAKITIL
jgi:hypothetical protein